MKHFTIRDMKKLEENKLNEMALDIMKESYYEEREESGSGS